MLQADLFNFFTEPTYTFTVQCTMNITRQQIKKETSNVSSKWSVSMLVQYKLKLSKC